MADPKQKFKEILLTALIGVLLSTAAALVSKEKSTLQKVKTLAAGILMCIGCALILTEVTMDEWKKQTICGVMSAGASTFWPALESRLKHFIETVEIPFFKTKSKKDE